MNSEEEEEFEEVEPTQLNSDSEDDNAAWDEVDVDEDLSATALARATASLKPLQIVIGNGKGKEGKKPVKRPGSGTTTRDRMLRQETHKLHLRCLLTVGIIRNGWINEPILQARILSKIPFSILHSFTSWNKGTHPNDIDRSRIFDKALKELIAWWYTNWKITSAKGIERRLVKDVQKELKALGWIDPKTLEAATNEGAKKDTKGKGREKAIPATVPENYDLDRYYLQELNEGGDYIRHFGALEKRAIEMKGSRDISVLLFTCLCRALDIGARLVFSLQPVDWRAPSTVSGGGRKTKAKPMAKGNSEGVGTEDDGERSRRASTVASTSKTDTSRNVSADEAPKEYRPKLRKGKTKKTVKALPMGTFERSPSPDAEEALRPPIFWTEIYSKSNREWIVVDILRKKMRCKNIMEPSRTCIENQMRYVLAYEEDGSIRDVTKRYTKRFDTVTAKERVPSTKGRDWLADTLLPYERSFKLNRDIAEEEELNRNSGNERMPTSLAGFKNHPNYVLEQHLKREEVIDPNSTHLTEIEGVKGGLPQKVFKRSAVLSLKSLENYLRMGRRIKSNEIPLKFVKSRSVTISKKRIEEAAVLEGQLPNEQELYSFAQTELYIADPIVDGLIPRNSFGNIDLYTPSMLPAGGTHVARKSAGRCAKSLGITFADAVTGFEFNNRRAHPILTGVVVATENAKNLNEAIDAFEKLQADKEEIKRQERCLKRWKTFILGLRIRQRVSATYSSKKNYLPEEGESQFSKEMEDLAGGSKGKKRAKAGSDETVIKAPAAATPQSRSGGRSIKFTLTEEKVVENGASRSGREKVGMGVAPAEESDDSLEYLSDF